MGLGHIWQQIIGFVAGVLMIIVPSLQSPSPITPISSSAPVIATTKSPSQTTASTTGNQVLVQSPVARNIYAATTTTTIITIPTNVTSDYQTAVNNNPQPDQYYPVIELSRCTKDDTVRYELDYSFGHVGYTTFYDARGIKTGNIQFSDTGMPSQSGVTDLTGYLCQPFAGNKEGYSPIATTTRASEYTIIPPAIKDSLEKYAEQANIASDIEIIQSIPETWANSCMGIIDESGPSECISGTVHGFDVLFYSKGTEAYGSIYGAHVSQDGNNIGDEGVVGEIGTEGQFQLY
ncbi:MAG TPA: hypothetical protein VMU13_03890 [Candidatus Paceibacterota bacterium]|nr:hypothetical protein [Candidatus Paceibacterota bacterium]